MNSISRALLGLGLFGACSFLGPSQTSPCKSSAPQCEGDSTLLFCDDATQLVLTVDCADQVCDEGQASADGSGCNECPLCQNAIYNPAQGKIGQQDIATDDFNGDGVFDLLTVNNSGTAHDLVLLGGQNQGAGQVPTFLAPLTLDVSVGVSFQAVGLTTLRLPDNNRPDVLVSFRDINNSILSLLADSTGTAPFSKLQDFTLAGFTAKQPVLAEINGDNFPDILVPGINLGGAAPGDEVGEVRIILGQPATPFFSTSAQRFVQLTVPGVARLNAERVVVADLDGDRNPDLVVSSGGGVGVTKAAVVLFGNGTGDFLEQKAFVVSTSTDLADVVDGLAVADFNQDGRLDFAVVSTGGAQPGKVTVFQNEGARSFSAQSIAVGNAPKSLDFGDFDEDGDIDLISSNLVNGQTRLILNKSPSGGDVVFRVSDAVLPNPPSAEIAVADLDRDGRPDFVFSNSDANRAESFFLLNPRPTP